MGRYTIRVPFYDDTYLNQKLTAQQTSFEVLRGKISAIISDSEIEEYRNGNTTMASKLSAAIQTVDGFSQQVSDIQSSFDAATGEFSTLVSKVSTFEQTVDGFEQTVASVSQAEQNNANAISALSGDVQGIEQSLGNYVLENQLVSKINQSADKIDLSVVNTSTLYSKTEVDNKLKDYTKTSGLNNYIIQNKSALGITDSQIVQKVTGSSYWSDQATAIQDLQDAQDEIDDLVASVQATANAASMVYYGNSAPKGSTSNPLKTGDLWIDTSNKNCIKRYNASNNTWTAVDNKDIATALSTAGTAKAIADGKIKTYTGNTQPAGSASEPLDVGDLWFDTGHDNIPYRWNGSNWISVQDATIAQAAQIAESAQNAAAKRVMTFYGSTTPTAQSTGDIWFNSVTKTNSKTGIQYKQNVIKRWNGSSWVEIQDTGAEKALLAAGDAQATADGKIQTFSQPAAPANNTTNNLDIGDLWFDSDDNNKIYRWNGSSWIEVRDGAIATLQSSLTEVFELADSKISTFYGSTTPSNPDTGDIWFQSVSKTNTKTGQSDKENVIKRYNGSTWVEIQDTGIETALNAAGAAQATADSKIETYFQQSAPTGTTANPLDEGDLWFNSADNNKCYRYNATSKKWVEVRDSQILEAYNLAAKKIKTYYGTSIPANDPPEKGDMWIDTTKDSNNKVAKVLKRYNGSAWEVMDSPYLMEAYDTACEAANLADHKMQVFYQTSAPQKTSSNLLDTGDLWIDSDDNNKMYRWNGSSWVSVQDGYIALAQATATEAMTTASKKSTTYRSQTEPTTETHPDLRAGDIWFNPQTRWDPQQGKTVAQNIIKRWNGTSWTDCSDSRLTEAIVGIANLDDEKAQIFMQTTAPADNEENHLDDGDLWVDTDDNNRIHIWNKTGSKWELADKKLDELVQWKTEAEISLTKDSIRQTITQWDQGGMRIVNMINQDTSGTQIKGSKVKIEANDSISLAIANGSIKPYHQTTAPSSPKQGDIWYDTSSQNYKIYTYNSGSWVETAKDKVAKNAVISAINADTSGVQISGDKINIQSSSNLRLMVTGKNKVFTQSTQPVREYDSTTNTYNFNKGDIWYDTSSNYKMYVCTYVSGSASTWTVASQNLVPKDGVISAINLSEETASIRASKIELTAGAPLTEKLNDASSNAKVFRSSSQPQQSVTNGIRNVEVGDIWYDTTSGQNKMYFCTKATNNDANWAPDNIINRINMSSEGITINANRLNIDVNDIRMKAQTIRWSSNYSSMSETGVLTSTDGLSSASTTVLERGYLRFKRTGTVVGNIGTNNLKNMSDYKGLVFDLEKGGSYMAWAANTDDDSDYELKMIYARKHIDYQNDSYAADSLNMLVSLDMHSQTIRNCGNLTSPGGTITTYQDSSHRGAIRSRFKSSDNTFGLATATIQFGRPARFASNGTASEWANSDTILTFKDGLLVSVQGGLSGTSYTRWTS